MLLVTGLRFCIPLKSERESSRLAFKSRGEKGCNFALGSPIEEHSISIRRCRQDGAISRLQCDVFSSGFAFLYTSQIRESS